MTPDCDMHFADHAWSGCAGVVEKEALSSNIFRIRIACPRIASTILPGQFLMVRLHGEDDPLIGRPFALFDTARGNEQLDFVFVVGGKMTRRLAKSTVGDQLDVWGPLGNGFSLESAQQVILVAGGIGYTPFLAVAKQYLGLQRYGQCEGPTADSPPEVIFCFGARGRSELVSLGDFKDAGTEVLTATDDGSAGHHGRVTDLLERVLDRGGTLSRRVLCCGPEPMMHACAEICIRQQIPCEVSLETPMACGIGICFSCVAPVRIEDGWDYRRTCVEGPVFSGNEICWEAL